MKTIIFAATLSVFALGACTETGGNNNQGTTNERNALPEQQDYVGTHSARMINDLNLDDDQSKRLNELNTTHYNEQRSMRQSQDNRTNAREREEAANENYDKKLRGILNDAQYQQYQSNRQNYSFDYNRNSSNTVAPTNNNRSTSNQGNTQGTSTPPSEQ